MKKLLLTLVSVTLILGLLAGCSNSGGQATTEPTPEQTAQQAESTVPAEPEPSAELEPSVEPEPAPEPEPVELFISAAASLTDVLTEIAQAYREVAPNVTLTFTFDSSGTLQTQIEEGAPADLFLSAAQKQMNALEDQGLIEADSRINLLVNKVVLIVPKDSEIDLTSFEDVATDKVAMVAIGDETVPVGQYTEEIYTWLGTWEQVKEKANLGANVRAVLAWVETGDVDCGIVYATDASSSSDVKVVCEAPEGSHNPVVYPAAVLADSEYKDDAAAFLEFLRSDIAVDLFEKAGFTMAD